MPYNDWTPQKKAEYQRDRRAKAKAAELEQERQASLPKAQPVPKSGSPKRTADAEALLTKPRMKVLCDCEPPSEEFPKGIKCWAHLIPSLTQEQRDVILSKVNKA